MHQRELEVGLVYLTQDAMVAAILTCLTDLHSLTLNVDYPPADLYAYDGRNFITISAFNRSLTIRLIELSMTPALTSFRMLSNVTSLTIHGELQEDEQQYWGWDSGLISMFIRLPALQKFSGRGCRDINSGDPLDRAAWTCGDGASKISDIEIYECKIGTETIRKMLRSARALRSFECSRHCKYCLEEVGQCDYSCVNLRNDLMRHRETLEELRLTSDSCGCTVVFEDDPIETLHGLEKLTYLELSQDVLIGNRNIEELRISEVLPLNLERVVIHGDWQRPQSKLFAEIGRALLANDMLPAIDVDKGRFREAWLAVKDLPGVEVERMGNEEGLRNCDLLIYRTEEEEAE